MRRRVLAFSICSAAVWLTSSRLTAAGDVPANLQEGYRTIQPGILKADLTFLASDPLEGRLSLTRGSEVAVQWIQSEFAKAGLKPFNGTNYLQTVPLWDTILTRGGIILPLTEP